MLCFGIGLLTVYVLMYSVFCIPDIYVIFVLIFYFFLEPVLMGLCLSGVQPPMTNKYCCCWLLSIHFAIVLYSRSDWTKICLFVHLNELANIKQQN